MASASKGSVFFDPGGKRAKRVRLATRIAACCFGIMSFVYLTGLYVAPNLPSPWLDKAQELEVATPPFKASEPDYAALEAGKPSYAARQRILPASARKTKRFGFVWVGDAAGAGQVRIHATDLDGIIVDLLTLEDKNGVPQVELANYSQWFMRWKRRYAAHATTLAQVSIQLPPARMAAAIATPESRAQIAGEMIARYRELGANGLILDARSVPESSHTNFVKLLYATRELARPSNGSVAVIVARGLSPTRLSELVRPVDFAIVHLFQDAAELPVPGPLAAQGWFEAELARYTRLIDPERLIIGIGSQAVAWNHVGISRQISVQAAWEVAQENRTRINLDRASLNPTFSYKDGAGLKHTVWILDAVTAFNHARSALVSGVAGIAVHRMGQEDPGVWRLVGRGKLPDRSAITQLEQPLAAADTYERAGYDVLRAQPGRPGKRHLQFNDGLGLITSAALVNTPVHVQFSGLRAAKPKTVALTFDDGPDPNSTPRILDILAAKNVKATFYIVGTNAARHPEIVQRIYAEGHDIGNHTYSHKDLSKLSPQEIALDLNGLQRLLEAQIGIRTILFRAPYAMANYREFITAPHLMSTISELGYVVGGIDIESYDHVISRTARQVHERVVRDTIDARSSVSVLLHDGGRTRDVTVEAVELIIDDLKSKGFTFTTTHEFIGLTRETVMPRHNPDGAIEAASTQVRGRYMVVFGQAGSIIGNTAIVAALIAIGRLLLIIVLAHVQRQREISRANLIWQPNSIAVLVPGYNEEKVICKTVQSLLASTNAQRLDIIVIDDGSTDRTSAIVTETFADHANVKVFRKTNGGKSAALNYGISRTTAEIIVAIDADTMLEPDAIELLVRHFHDPRLGAVAGNAIVGNQCNMITRMQALEYVTSQNLERRALETINAIPVVPGAIGAWRRAALIEAGGYGHDTLAEDADLTIELERRNWKVIYEPRAKALTEAPETVKAFLKQRFRWMFGTLQVAVKNLVRPRGMPLQIALVIIPNVIVFSFAFTLLAPIVDVILITTILTSLAGLSSEVSGVHVETLRSIGLYWLLFQSVDVMVAFLAIRMDSSRSNFALLPWIFVQRFTYRQLLYWVALKALFAAIKGQFVGWGKLLRTGNVVLQGTR
jgi:cellulose synthase/poly-beta-1,6-N-acetylglucosamine synthase-like glycosyltransferase/peptidoglycan/xylan/chitin deacetylase (PgdA/CDA1 family)